MPKSHKSRWNLRMEGTITAEHLDTKHPGLVLKAALIQFGHPNLPNDLKSLRDALVTHGVFVWMEQVSSPARDAWLQRKALRIAERAVTKAARRLAAPADPLVRVAGYTVQTPDGPVVVPGGDIPASQVEDYCARRDKERK